MPTSAHRDLRVWPGEALTTVDRRGYVGIVVSVAAPFPGAADVLVLWIG